MHNAENRTIEFLSALVDPEQGKFGAGDVAVIVAHPDDETIGCGAQLARLEGVHIITVTDGAPRRLKDARAHGCNTVAEYRELRIRELRKSLSEAAVSAEQLTLLGIPDQQAAFKLDWLTARLMTLLRAKRVRVVLTHAYEGGHPDHDATAFCVHRAASLLGTSGPTFGIIEMPIYREKGGQLTPQSFAPAGSVQSMTVHLKPEQIALKLRMRAAHASQANLLSNFKLEIEQFRRAPGYDFRLPANGGNLVYERFDWGLNGKQWREVVTAVVERIGTARSVR